jgi:hypothetical protein
MSDRSCNLFHLFISSLRARRREKDFSFAPATVFFWIWGINKHITSWPVRENIFWKCARTTYVDLANPPSPIRAITCTKHTGRRYS